MKREDVVASILRAIDAYNAAGHEPQLDKSRGDQTPLYGPDGLLDSVGLVEFIMDVEDALRADCGLSITLADQRALSQRSSPFRSVSALADYVLSRPDGE